MAKCEICNSVYNSRLAQCPKEGCAAERAAIVAAAEAKRVANATHRKNVRRPLLRGKFGRGPRNG